MSSRLEKITIKGNVTVLREGTFEDCEDLKSITMPDSVVTMERFVFRNCEKLKTVKLSKNLTSIGKESFNGCAALKTVYFPENAEILGENIFAEGCNSLTGINLAQKEKARIYAIVGAMTGNLKVAYYE